MLLLSLPGCMSSYAKHMNTLQYEHVRAGEYVYTYMYTYIYTHSYMYVDTHRYVCTLPVYTRTYIPNKDPAGPWQSGGTAAACGLRGSGGLGTSRTRHSSSQMAFSGVLCVAILIKRALGSNLVSAPLIYSISCLIRT